MARNLLLGFGFALVLGAAALPLRADDEAVQTVAAEKEPLFSTHGTRASFEARERLAQLLQMPKEQLWEELRKWPAFHQMTLQEQGNFLSRLAEMRQHIRAQALHKAAEMGLKIPPDKEEAYVNAYIRERMEMEKKIWQETQPKRRQLDEEMKANLRRDYGTAGESLPAPAQTPPPAAPANAPAPR